MAIGKVAGPTLYSTLDRQGVDLQFTTNNEPLLYLDFANFRAGINTNVISSTLTINGNLQTSNIKIDSHTITSDSDLTLATAGNLHLGNLANIKINGGSLNYLLTTDGTGNLSWQNVNDVSAELSLAGTNIKLGTPTDGSLVDHASYRRWTANTTITDATDHLNQVILNLYQNTYVGNVSFTSNVVSGPSPLTVQFNSSVFGNPTSYYWEFGDGYTSTDANPTHTYANQAGGLYSVYFKAYNVNGTRNGEGQFGTGSQGAYYDNQILNYITLYTPAPIPSFTLDKTILDDQTSVLFNNTSHFAESYVIHWGDGQITTVTDNSAIGGVSGSPASHTYNNVLGDTAYPITLSAFSSTAGITGLTVTSDPTQIYVYSGHAPDITANVTIGNNQHTTLPFGLTVGFTNHTASSPGPTSIFTNNRYTYNWGDGTTSNVSIGTNAAGDTNNLIGHTFTLVDPKVEQTYSANLQVFNGNSTSPFTSTPINITVKPSPTAIFTANAIAISDRIGDTAQTGYLFTDLAGVNRATFTFKNDSYNTDTYNWSYGDGNTLGPLTEGDAGTPTGGTVNHTYGNTGTKTVSLLAHGVNSISLSDDTLIKNSYINILSAPLAPANVGAQTLTMTSFGTDPLLAALAVDNTNGSAPAAGSAVNRITVSAVNTNTLTDVYNSDSGTMNAVFNGNADVSVNFTLGDDSGIYGSLSITQDRDAHLVNPNVYPTNFYRVFSGNLSKSNAAIPVGYNSLQLAHSSAGNTNVLGFVKDDVVLPPTLDITAVVMSTSTAGTLKYISGIPYFGVNGQVTIQGLNAYNWIGQCYLNAASPLSVTAGSVDEGSGSTVATQGKSYTNMNGSTSFLSSGLPKANTGKTSATPYNVGSFPILINGSGALTGKVKLQLANVNGLSSIVELPTLINVFNVTATGLDELSIPVSTSLGSGYSDNGKRVILSTGVGGATPVYDPLVNYYVTRPFSGNVPVNGTDEAVVRFGTLSHNITNYNSYLPTGPDLSGRAGMQYFRFAFRRATTANFTITLSGHISGVWIAAPNTQIDSTSTLNGWLDAAQVYGGSGIPGSNILAGGNGSNGCAKTAGDVAPLFMPVTNGAFTLTLGSENSSNATGSQILVSIAIDTGDYLTSISVS